VKKTFFTLCILFTLFVPAKGQKPVFNSVLQNNSSIEKYDEFELTIDLKASYTNPYDYDTDRVVITESPEKEKL
jgi:hypothetical protein